MAPSYGMNKKPTESTIQYYEQDPEGFWQGTKDHDVSQNYQSLLNNISTEAPYQILDFGCGPGRDLKYFSDLGHKVVGLDGSASFCKMAHEYSGCEVLNQDFISLDLPRSFFDGIFANASLFHVPKAELPRVLREFHLSLKEQGVLFSSNPRGSEEMMNGLRYANYMQVDEYKELVEQTGFELRDHYFRPNDVPVEQAPWLACVFIKK